MGRVCVAAGIVAWVAAAALFGPLRAVGQTPTAAPGATAGGNVDAQQAVLRRYCVTCHHERSRTGGLALDSLSLTDVPSSAETSVPTGELTASSWRGGFSRRERIPTRA